MITKNLKIWPHTTLDVIMGVLSLRHSQHVQEIPLQNHD